MAASAAAAPAASAARASGVAVVAGAAVPLRSALAWRDGFGDVIVLLTPQAASCASVSAPHRGPYVWAWVHRTGSGPARVVVTFAPRAGAPTAVRSRGGLVLGRGTWNGTLRVPSRTAGGRRLAATASFDARWCGRR